MACLLREVSSDNQVEGSILKTLARNKLVAFEGRADWWSLEQLNGNQPFFFLGEFFLPDGDLIFFFFFLVKNLVIFGVFHHPNACHNKTKIAK